MGKVFELISDEAFERLKKDKDYCDVCEQANVEIYPYQGMISLPEATDVDDYDEFYYVCYDCITDKRIQHICDFDYIPKIDKYLDQQNLSKDKEVIRKTLIDKYQRTPDYPIFMQCTDIPLCCNDITEFTGYPRNDEELYEISEKNTYWEFQVKGKSDDYNFRITGSPESYIEVAAFRCKHCKQNYFTFQFT